MKSRGFCGYVAIVAAGSLAACSSHGISVAPPTNGAPAIRRAAVSSYKIVHNFGKTGKDGTHLDGAYPNGVMVFGNGALYGTTGGPSGAYTGTVFTMMPDGSRYRTLRLFSEPLHFPHGITMLNGTLYGATDSSVQYRGGALFSLATSGKFAMLHRFGGAGDGRDANGLTAANGTLYGTTRFTAGGYTGGTVFSLSPTGSTYVVLHFFGKGTDGDKPNAVPIFTKGSLYGTTAGGGRYHQGTVFRIGTKGAHPERVLHSFGNGTDAKNPEGALIFVKWTLYGTTAKGGKYKKGTIFAMNLDGSNERVIHSFGAGKDGQTPWSNLLAGNGVLYGTTTAGGTYGKGVVYSIGIDGKNERILHDFGAIPNDGFDVWAPLISEGGTLYGVTMEGGIYVQVSSRYPDSGGGTAFALTP